MKKYKCEVCGFILESETIPKEDCPVCGADSDAYVLVDED